MTNIFDAVRIAIEHRLGDDMRSNDIMANIPAYVRRAVFKMQQTNVIEPTQIEYTDLDLQEYFDTLGNAIFDFISLPDDYTELHKIFVNDKVPEWYVSTKGIRAKAQQNQGVVYYSINSVLVNGANERILALANVPEGATITLQYHAGVTEESVQNLPERYWEAVIKQVESYLNLPGTQDAIMNERRAKEEVEELASGWRNQTQVIFRSAPRFFGGGRRNGRLVR